MILIFVDLEVPWYNMHCSLQAAAKWYTLTKENIFELETHCLRNRTTLRFDFFSRLWSVRKAMFFFFSGTWVDWWLMNTLHSIFHCRLVCFSTCLTFSLYNVFKKSESDFFGSNFSSSHDMFLYSKAFCCHHFHWSCLFIKILLFYFVVFFINQNIFKYKLISELYLVFSFKVVNKQKYLLFNTTLKLNTSLFWLKQ